MPTLLTRRTLRSIENAIIALPSWMPRLSFAPAHTAPRGDTLVVVFLRGAADVLNMVVPHGDEAYYRARPTLGIARPDDNLQPSNLRSINLDGFFGFHPALKPLLPVWQAKHLAIIHACGAPDESRSHFKAMELMERGVEDEKGPASGWIGRHLATLNTGNQSPLRAVGFGDLPIRSLIGGVPISTLRSIADFHLGGDTRALAQMQAALNSLYSGSDQLSVVGQETLEIMDTLVALDPTAQSPISSLQYPQTDFGLGLNQIAMLIRAEVGLEVAAIDLGGWDTHFAQGGSEGLMAGLMKELAEGLAAFYADTADHADWMTVVTMSEFGRRVSENGSLGTDHGHGSMMMLMGGNVIGGKVHGQWPGLSEGQLVGPGDLAVTTDYRDVLAEVLAKRLNNPAVEQIFPNYTPTLRQVLKE
ncbi:MAG TPA: DUF1501 domain-containing protein [Anaerolineales bacterium]|nr:DUF1501 domain-containing protein [Anaerolineales bacterium]